MLKVKPELAFREPRLEDAAWMNRAAAHQRFSFLRIRFHHPVHVAAVLS